MHFFCQLVLLNAYKHAELTQVYPVARGLSALIIILVSTTFLGYYPSKYELLGIIFILIAFTLYGVKIGLTSKADLKGFYFAACAGCFIASYSLVDRYGVRIAQNAIAFYSAVTIINGVNFFFVIFVKF
ncbi:MAG: hypothetical protein CL532_02090 [Aestuariivita sp.]|nr:hypothetical protein [Aestuariivita sp.]